MIRFKSSKETLTKLHSHKVFELFVIAVILVSALITGAKTYDVPPLVAQTFFYFDWLVTLFFLLEISIRLLAEDRTVDFFKKGWNLFDFAIVTVSLIPMEGSDMALVARLLRVFRVLRLVSMIPELRMLLAALYKSLPRMGYVVLLMFIIFYIYGAFGSFLFDEINPVLWGNISISMLTLFRISTFEDWTDVMYETMEVYPLSWIFYLTFIFLTAFVFLNMMIGIVLEVMQRESEAFSRETGEGEAAEVHAILEQNRQINNKLDTLEQLIRQQQKR